MTITSSIASIVLISLAVSCSDKTIRQSNIINFKDTIYRNTILMANNGDTMRQKDTIYFAPTDLKVDTSGFYYSASANPWSQEKEYKIFFPRKKVIDFCDSMLNTFPPNPTNEMDDFFEERNLYKTLKEEAVSNRLNEAIRVDELPTLLERFSPFILNPYTGDKPAYIIITKREEYTSELKLYQIKTKTGDTILLDVNVIKPVALETIN